MTKQNVEINVNLTGAEATAKGMSYIGAAADSFGNKVASKMTAMFSAVAVGAMVFDKIGEAMSKNMATAKQISSLSAKFHIDPKEVHSLMLAANDAGVQVRSLLMGMKQLGQYASKSIVDPDKASILKQMGFDMAKLNELSSKPAAHLADISQGLMRIGNENDRNRVGTALLGRQYQQLLPLIEKLGTSAEARSEFLNNENAMTAEQVEQNKEMARMQSKMNEEWEALIAGLTPVALLFTGMLNTIISMVEWVIKLGSSWDMYVKGLSNEAQNRLLIKEKEIRTAASNGTLSKEDAALLKKKGSLDEFVYAKLQQESTAMKNEARGVGGTIAAVATGGLTEVEVSDNEGLIADSGVQKGSRAYMENMAKKANERRSAAKAKKDARVSKVSDDADRERAAIKAEEEKELEDIVDGKFSSTKGKTDEEVKEQRDREIRLHTDKFKEKRAAHARDIGNRLKHAASEQEGDMPKDVSDQMKGSVEFVQGSNEQYSKDFDKWLGSMQVTANKYGKSIASMGKALGMDVHFDTKSGSFKKGKQEEKDVGDNIEIVDAAAAKKEKRHNEKQERALKKSERYKRGDETGVALAQEKVDDAKLDASDAQKDLDAAKEAEDPKQKAYDAAVAKVAAIKQDMLNAAQKNKDGKLTNIQKAGFNDVLGAAQTEVSGSKAELQKAKDERISKQIVANTADNAVKGADAALIKARDAEWAKERKHQEDLHKDKMDDLRNENEEKYRTMKLNGSSEQEIAEERFNDEMKMYEDAVKEKEALDAAIQARRDKRYDEAVEAGMDEAEVGAAYEMTDEEKAMSKGHREQVDAGRKKTQDALFAIDPNAAKSAAVVSDLGKIGGGGAVQFGGNNPVDEIRKSNKWLEVIAKGVTSDKFSNLGVFGNWMDENDDGGAGAAYGPNKPSR